VLVEGGDLHAFGLGDDGEERGVGDGSAIGDGGDARAAASLDAAVDAVTEDVRLGGAAAGFDAHQLHGIGDIGTVLVFRNHHRAVPPPESVWQHQDARMPEAEEVGRITRLVALADELPADGHREKLVNQIDESRN